MEKEKLTRRELIARLNGRWYQLVQGWHQVREGQKFRGLDKSEIAELLAVSVERPPFNRRFKIGMNGNSRYVIRDNVRDVLLSDEKGKFIEHDSWYEAKFYAEKLNIRYPIN